MWAYHTDATTHSIPQMMLSSLLPVGVSHRCPIFPQSFMAQTGRRVVREGMKRVGGGVGPRPGGRKAILDSPKKCTYGIDFSTRPPTQCRPGCKHTQQPCDDNIRCRDIPVINLRSTHFVSGSASEFEHTLPATRSQPPGVWSVMA